jgi:hypothetical protein
MFNLPGDNMNLEKKNYDAAEQESGKESGSDSTADQTIFERGAEAYGQAEQAVSDAYDKTSEKARSLSVSWNMLIYLQEDK